MVLQHLKWAEKGAIKQQKKKKREKGYKAKEFFANEGSFKFLFGQQLFWTWERLEKRKFLLGNKGEFATDLRLEKYFRYRDRS